jgi:hypothetical protein
MCAAKTEPDRRVTARAISCRVETTLIAMFILFVFSALTIRSIATSLSKDTKK